MGHNIDGIPFWGGDSHPRDRATIPPDGASNVSSCGHRNCYEMNGAIIRGRDKNMRLLVLINNYMGGNTSNADTAVEKVVETFRSYTRLDVDIVLFSTQSWDDPDVVNLVYPEALSYDFAYVHRRWLLENFCCLSHDYFMYTENDLIIPESAALHCIANNTYLSRFPGRWISGFIRFEKKPEKKYIDMLASVRPTVEKHVQSDDGRKFWIPGNIHSGNYLLSRPQLGYLIDHHLLQVSYGQYGKQFGGILESAASDVYLDFIKVLPQDFTTVEIEHLSGKYDGLTHPELAREVAMPS
jgi:hypothetical protein